MTTQTEKSGHEQHAEHREKVDLLLHKCRHLMPGNLKNEHAWNLCDLCVRYGLDPVSGDVAWLPNGNIPYVTFRGMVRIAHNSGQLQGMEVELVHVDHDKNDYLVKAKIYKTGCQYPFEDYGDSNARNNQVKGMALIKIATTRAKCRALRSAFPIAMPVDGDSAEEMNQLFENMGTAPPAQHTQQQPAQVQQPEPTPPEQVQQQPAPVNPSQSAQPENPPPGEPTSHQAQQVTSGQSPSTPPNDGLNTEAWVAAKKRLSETMKGYNVTGSQVRSMSLEMHGVGQSSELNARQINTLVMVIQEEHQPAALASAAAARPTGPQPPPDRA